MQAALSLKDLLETIIGSKVLLLATIMEAISIPALLLKQDLIFGFQEGRAVQVVIPLEVIMVVRMPSYSCRPVPIH